MCTPGVENLNLLGLAVERVGAACSIDLEVEQFAEHIGSGALDRADSQAFD